MFSLLKTPSLIYEAISYTVGGVGNNFTTLITDGTNTFNGVANPGSGIFAPPVLRINSQNELEGLAGTTNGEIVIYDLGGLPANNPQIKDVFDFDPYIKVKQISSTNSYFSFIADSTSLSVNNPLFYDRYLDV